MVLSCSAGVSRYFAVEGSMGGRQSDTYAINKIQGTLDDDDDRSAINRVPDRCNAVSSRKRERCRAFPTYKRPYNVLLSSTWALGFFVSSLLAGPQEPRLWFSFAFVSRFLNVSLKSGEFPPIHYMSSSSSCLNCLTLVYLVAGSNKPLLSSSSSSFSSK